MLPYIWPDWLITLGNSFEQTFARVTLSPVFLRHRRFVIITSPLPLYLRFVATLLDIQMKIPPGLVSPFTEFG